MADEEHDAQCAPHFVLEVQDTLSGQTVPTIGDDEDD